MVRINRILVGHDFTSFSDAALLEAARIGRRLEAEVHVAFVEVLHRDLNSMEANAATRSERLRSELQKRFSSIDGDADGIFKDVNVRFEVLRDVAAGPALLAYADENDIDLIIVGTHGRRGFQRMLMGSVAEEVVRKATCPVLTMHDKLDRALELTSRRIVAPVDFSQHSLQAVRNAKELAHVLKSDLLLVHVLEERLHPAFYNTGMFSQYDAVPDIENRAQEELHRFFEQASGPDVTVDYQVRRGNAVREITRTAREQSPALIVMATHGLTGLDHFLMGSVTEKVVRQSECPVLTVKSFGKRLVDEVPAAPAGSDTPPNA